ncbi:FAD-dependent oxidoreductase [Rhodospirillaceae bacterium]|nr:FAD-dependent oxidoreductase [Rhodospirillaceae bacterium]
MSLEEQVEKMEKRPRAPYMKPTDISDPNYFHKVVDCQWACPAHTPVPEYIRMIAQQRYTEAYMINWESNVFPGVLGRTCDRPCEPACRRGRIEDKPVAICRLKRVAADHRGDIEHLMPSITPKNGQRVACIGGGPASLTVARDLIPLGYEVVIFDRDSRGGGMMRSQIPAFRLPESVLNEEVDRILNFGAKTHFNHDVTSLKHVLDDNFDAVFVGTGAPKGRDIDIPGRSEVQDNFHIGIDWLMSVAFEHTSKIGKKVVVLGGGNTAMDCCRTAKRLGGEVVKVIVRSPFDEMKASPWEIEDAQNEDIEILNNHVPEKFLVEDGKLTGIVFQKVKPEYDETGRRKLVPTGDDPVIVQCDDVLCAIGQENHFPWIERDIGLEFDEWDMPVVDRTTFQSTNPKVFFGGDAAFGPENIIWAVAHGHQAAISIDQFCQSKDINQRPAPDVTLISQKMGMHEWSYHNDISTEERYAVPHAEKMSALKDIKLEVELGFDEKMAFEEAMRCLNCDVQTVFEDVKCIECDACVDICPVDCINFIKNGDEAEVRSRLRVPALDEDQSLYVSDTLPTGRVMVKDEDVCLHCGLCAERCPTAAWDMTQFLLKEGQAKNQRQVA